MKKVVDALSNALRYILIIVCCFRGYQYKCDFQCTFDDNLSVTHVSFSKSPARQSNHLPAWKALLLAEIPIWNPVMSTVYTGRSMLHTWYPESLEPWTLIPHCNWILKCGDWRTGSIGVQSANPLTPDNFFWLLLWTAYTIGPMSADQHKQFSIRRGARSFQLRGGLAKLLAKLKLWKFTGIKGSIRKT
jgi:hypothetical protein